MMKFRVEVLGVPKASGVTVSLANFGFRTKSDAERACDEIDELVSKHWPAGWVRFAGMFVNLSGFVSVELRVVSDQSNHWRFWRPRKG